MPSAKTSLRRSIDGSRADCVSRNVHLVQIGIAEHIQILGDEPALEQLFANLIANAIQASAPDGVVAYWAACRRSLLLRLVRS